MQQLLVLAQQFLLYKRTNWIAALVAMLLAALSPAQTASGPSAQLADLQRDWREQKDLLVKLADAMPDDKFGYKPTPAQRSYGEQIAHIAISNVASMRMLGTTRPTPFNLEFDRAKGNPEELFARAGKQDIIRKLSEAYDFGAAVLAEQTPETINALVDTRMPFWGGSTRARVVWLLLSHSAIHHDACITIATQPARDCTRTRRMPR